MGGIALTVALGFSSSSSSPFSVSVFGPKSAHKCNNNNTAVSFTSWTLASPLRDTTHEGAEAHLIGLGVEAFHLLPGFRDFRVLIGRIGECS